nr:hypothetical protein GCM10025732_23810 [Glycomyces mayteni]
MAGGAGLVDLEEDGVGVAVDGDGDDGLVVPGGLALDPVRAAAARPVGGLPGGEGAPERLRVHPREHEHFARVVLLRDRGHEPVGVERQLRQDLFSTFHGYRL